MVAEELVPPTVTVHDNVVDEPAPIVMPELEVGSPEQVKPLGQDSAYDVVTLLDDGLDMVIDSVNV